MRNFAFLGAAAGVVLCFCASAAPPDGRSPELWALMDEHVEFLLRENPTWASARGDERWNDRLGDESPGAYARRLAETQDRLARLMALDRSGWGEDDRLDADLLAYRLGRGIERAKFHDEQSPIDQRSGPQVWLPQLGDGVPMLTRKHREDYVRRLRAVPMIIDQMIEQMRAGMAAGRVPPRVTVLGTDAQAFALATAAVEADPSLSPFYGPMRGLGDDDPLAAEARAAIVESIVPAYRKLGSFLRDEYIPAARDTIGISDGVDGVPAYEFALRTHTTTVLSAREVHELGLSEVARIRSEMMAVIARSDFDGAGRGGEELFHAFVEHLRTDPRFYFDTPDELLAGYRDICKRMDAELPRFFGRLPRLPYGVKEMAAFQAPTSPTAYYYRGSIKAGLPGFFIANTYRLDQRPKYEMIALALHEAVPGHHLQISLAQELEDVHELRTMSGETAYIEGWALYSERIGLETGVRPGPIGDGGDGGMYADPYDDFGRLTYEMWRACRLVVDTGIHALGWSRDEAITFMQANTGLSRLNIEREVDRYIAWPGQACAYKIGELKIRELRRRAESALGDGFDLRAFHDCVLGAGSLPLPALEARVNRWIEALAEPAAPDAGR